jgi:Recombination endonuclease VII
MKRKIKGDCEKCGEKNWNKENKCQTCLNAKARENRANASEEQKAKQLAHFRSRKIHRYATHKIWASANPEKMRAKSMRANYKIDTEEYARILATQNGRCAICNESESIIKNGKLRKLSIDHNHACCSKRSCGKCIRGILCQTCNSGLGFFQDSIELLLSAVSYLRKFQLNGSDLHILPETRIPDRTILSG